MKEKSQNLSSNNISIMRQASQTPNLRIRIFFSQSDKTKASDLKKYI